MTRKAHAQRGALAVEFDERKRRLANTRGSGGPNGAGNGFRVADVLGSEGHKQSRVGGSEPDEGENPWINGG